MLLVIQHKLLYTGKFGGEVPPKQLSIPNHCSVTSRPSTTITTLNNNNNGSSNPFVAFFGGDSVLAYIVIGSAAGIALLLCLICIMCISICCLSACKKRRYDMRRYNVREMSDTEGESDKSK